MAARTGRIPGAHPSKKDPAGVGSGLPEIPDLSRAVLAERWTRIYGATPPKGIGRRLLEYAAAYELQAHEHGGLNPAIRQRLRRLATSNERPVKTSTRAAKALAPGSRLVRQWRGRTYIVDVVENGFLCGGKRYRSLSKLAHAITGARWSGPRFFGL